MMEAQIRQQVTIEEFEAFVTRPENSEKIFELIAGEVYGVPSNGLASKIAAKILMYIGIFLLKNDIGHVTGADGGYIVNGQVYAPDAAFISYDRQPEVSDQGFIPNPPELAVEVISDPTSSQEQEALRRKVANYLAVGTVVWVVNPKEQLVEIYQIGQKTQDLSLSGVIDGGDVLPGFKLAIKDIFPVKQDE